MANKDAIDKIGRNEPHMRFCQAARRSNLAGFHKTKKKNYKHERRKYKIKLRKYKDDI